MGTSGQRNANATEGVGKMGMCGDRSWGVNGVHHDEVRGRWMGRWIDATKVQAEYYATEMERAPVYTHAHNQAKGTTSNEKRPNAIRTPREWRRRSRQRAPPRPAATAANSLAQQQAYGCMIRPRNVVRSCASSRMGDVVETGQDVQT